VGSLVAVGGVHVPGDHVRELEIGLDAPCAEFVFPVGGVFKVVRAARGSREHAGLVLAHRGGFNLCALALVR
jgi:hypothetical protein